MKTKLLAASILISCISCSKKEESSSPATKFNASHGLYISSEGNFQSANSSVTYYYPSNNSLVSDVYKQVNGHSPGDICQSINMINGKVYLVVNNSGKIVVCNANSMENISTISGLTSPRFIIQVDSSKAYVSDLASNHISVINLNTNAITSTIQLNGWTEQMLVLNNKVYVTNVSTDYLYVLNPSNDQIIDSILITKGASSITSDANGKLWVLCGSDYLGTYTGAIHRINPTNATVEQSFTFPLPDNPNHLCMNATKDSLYYINTNIYKMSISAVNLPVVPFVNSNTNTFYSMSVDPSTNQVYISDAIDYIQKGRVYRYNSNATLVNSFLAGILPGDFLFF